MSRRAARPGFAAVVGNPPWVSYAGRASQPLDPARRAAYGAAYESFAGFRNLQGLFVERATALLAPRGRLGIVLPSSMSEQAGYAATRAAHDRRCRADAELLDLGEDAFAGVTQPAMALTSTRLDPTGPAAPTPTPGTRWQVARADLDEAGRGVLARMRGAPLPPELFGERGLQTHGDDLAHLRPAPDARHTVALRAGADVAPYRLAPPSFWADPAWFGARLRPAAAYGEVRVLVRQTSEFPRAAPSDGLGFRNSVLAGFADPDHPAPFLVAYLNATATRFFHFHSHRDARQGLPQVKIGHLRAIPRPPGAATVAALARLGEALAAEGVTVPGAPDPALVRAVDATVAEAFGFDDAARRALAAFARRFKFGP